MIRKTISRLSPRRRFQSPPRCRPAAMPEGWMIPSPTWYLRNPAAPLRASGPSRGRRVRRPGRATQSPWRPPTGRLWPANTSLAHLSPSPACVSRSALALIHFDGTLYSVSQADSVSHPISSRLTISQFRIPQTPRQARRRLPRVLGSVSSGSYPTKTTTRGRT